MTELSSTPINARLVGNEAFEELAELIAFKKQGNPLTPITVVSPSLYTGLVVRRQISALQVCPTMRARNTTINVASPTYGITK